MPQCSLNSKTGQKITQGNFNWITCWETILLGPSINTNSVNWVPGFSVQVSEKTFQTPGT